VLKALADRTDVLLEGGPRSARAFLRAVTIAAFWAYVAPILPSRNRLTASTRRRSPDIALALRWRYDGCRTSVRPRSAAEPGTREPAHLSSGAHRPRPGMSISTTRRR